MSKIEMPKADLEIIVKDEEGNIVHRQSGPSHSWVKNFYQYILGQCTGVHQTQTTYATEFYNTSGTAYAGYMKGGPDFYIFRGWGSQGLWAINEIGGWQNFTGCQIGTGTSMTTESFTDYALEGYIPDGIVAGTMVKNTSTQSFTTSTAGTVLKMKHDRSFTNNSGGVIPVTESALYAYLTWRDGAAQSTFMINRDTFGAISVANGSTIYVAYTIKLTLPYAIHS